MSCIRSFWNTTLPGVVAMLTPSSNALVRSSRSELAAAALDVVEQVVQALHEVLAAGRDGLAEHLGIGQREVRRRQRVDVLAREEVDLLLGVLVEAVDLPPGRAASAQRSGRTA